MALLLLDKFVAEINKLSTVGFSGDFPVIGSKQIFASLCQVASDNLALTSLFGFIESFSADYFCTMCYGTKDEIQDKFYDNMFQLSTRKIYRIFLMRLKITDEGLRALT